MQWTKWAEDRFNELLAGTAANTAQATAATAAAEAAVVAAEDAAAAALLAATLVKSYERWFAAATVPNAEIHVADRIGTSVVPFALDGGAGVGGSWGNWVQILGSADTPAEVGNVTFDLFKLSVTAVERFSTFYFMQVGFGSSGAAALAAGTYTEFVWRSGAALTGEAPINFQTNRQNATTKAWARCWAIGADTGTIGFVIGLHEYNV